MDDARALLRRIEADGIAAFEPVVRAVSPRLYRVAARMLGDTPDAEDAVQEAFIRAYDALRSGRYDERMKMEAWLVTIVTRVAIDALRSRKGRPEADEAAVSSAPGRAGGDDAAVAMIELARWVDGLPPDQRAAVVLRFMEGMTSAEVAAALGISEGAVEQRILRARATLRKRMEPDESG